MQKVTVFSILAPAVGDAYLLHLLGGHMKSRTEEQEDKCEGEMAHPAVPTLLCHSLDPFPKLSFRQQAVDDD
jgi:hypothetical protein